MAASITCVIVSYSDLTVLHYIFLQRVLRLVFALCGINQDLCRCVDFLGAYRKIDIVSNISVRRKGLHPVIRVHFYNSNRVYLRNPMILWDEVAIAHWSKSVLNYFFRTIYRISVRQCGRILLVPWIAAVSCVWGKYWNITFALFPYIEVGGRNEKNDGSSD